MAMQNETRVVLIGKTGHGKSETGNSILNCTDAFLASSDLCSVTLSTRRRTLVTDSKTIAVVDTPGMFDTNVPEHIVFSEVIKCIGLLAPGPHAFLYVLEVGTRLTKEELETLDKFVQLFGEDLYKFLIIVFTHKKKLGTKSVQEYANNAPPLFKKVLNLCNNRIIAIENVQDIADRQKTVNNLLLMIEELKSRSESFYHHEYFNMAQKVIAERMVELGKNAKRSDVLDEIETGGQAFNNLIEKGLGLLVFSILVTAGGYAAAKLILNVPLAVALEASAKRLSKEGTSNVKRVTAAGAKAVASRTTCVII